MAILVSLALFSPRAADRRHLGRLVPPVLVFVRLGRVRIFVVAVVLAGFVLVFPYRVGHVFFDRRRLEFFARRRPGSQRLVAVFRLEAEEIFQLIDCRQGLFVQLGLRLADLIELLAVGRGTLRGHFGGLPFNRQQLPAPGVEIGRQCFQFAGRGDPFDLGHLIVEHLPG